MLCFCSKILVGGNQTKIGEIRFQEVISDEGADVGGEYIAIRSCIS